MEDWKPLFMAATSTLVALAGEKAAIQMLPSYLIRRDYEKAIALEAINEKTLEQAFSVLTENLDPPIDLYEATSRYRAMQWSVGERIDDFITKLWAEARRSNHSTKQLCITLVTQLPTEVQPVAKRWLNDKGDGAISDKEVREFIRLVQNTLSQKGLPMDYGTRSKEAGVVKLLTERESAFVGGEDLEPDNKIQAIRTGRRVQVDSRTSYRELPREGCFTCGNKGHMWRNCPERYCNKCGRKGHDRYQCRVKTYTQSRINMSERIIGTDGHTDDERDQRQWSLSWGGES